MADADTARVRRLYDHQAPRYDAIVEMAERLLLDDGRVWAARQASGDTLEVAVGTGRNLPHYPGAVTLTGLDISGPMLALAAARAGRVGRPARLVLGDAQVLPFPDGCFDTIVMTLSLCTIPDDRRALTEAWRVLRAGGRLILLEHVRSTNRAVRWLQRLLDPLTVRFAGDHWLRDPLDHLAGVGFIVTAVERRRAGLVERTMATRPIATP